jgi:dimethylaniline monooxygenase (N-oxide forming)
MSNTTLRVAVIGGGFAGVCSAKYMLGFGHNVTVYEAGSNLGGLWVYENDNGRAQAYKHLCIISTRKHTHFSDLEFEPGTPSFPTHWDMHRYIQRYAEVFDVVPHVRFCTRVSAVEPESGDAGGWNVRTEEGTVERYDAVIVATGHLNEPSHPDELRKEFSGAYRHSSEYRVPDPYVGKRVAVVGMGNSGMDIASDVCGAAERTVLVARSGVVIQPKVVFGFPFSDIAIWMRERRWLPNQVRTLILSMLIFMAHGDQSRLGLRKPNARHHPTSSESIVSHIEFNRVAIKPEITKVSGKTLTFADGSEEDFDVLVAATGYKVTLPFLSGDIVPIKGNHVDLYKRIFPPHWPGLYFVGMLNPLTALNLIFEEQAKVIAKHLDGSLSLPSPADMLADIERKQALAAASYTTSPRHELEEPDAGYVDELRYLLSSARNELGRLTRTVPFVGPIKRLAWLVRSHSAQHDTPTGV